MKVAEMFDAVAERLVAQGCGVDRGRIMHSEGLRAPTGRFFAFLRGGELVIKLSAERVRELCESNRGAPFDAGKGRAMREWVVVAPETERHCEAYLDEALRFATSKARR